MIDRLLHALPYTLRDMAALWCFVWFVRQCLKKGAAK